MDFDSLVLLFEVLRKKKIIILTVFLAVCSQVVWADALIYKDNLGRKIFTSDEYGQEVIIKLGDEATKIIPEFSETIKKNDLLNGESNVFLGYDRLVPRGSFKVQPKLFDDVTGDGNPDILIIEMTNIITNGSAHSAAIRLLSVIDGEIEESRPYFFMIGEALHFDDFDNDGVFELVNTDMERRFLYSKSGMPISSNVYIYDTHYKEYYSASYGIMGDELK